MQQRWQAWAWFPVSQRPKLADGFVLFLIPDSHSWRSGMRLLKETFKSSQTRCFSLQDYRRWNSINEMELNQSQITFSYCKDILRVQTLWCDWWKKQQAGGPKLSSSDLDTSPSSPCFPCFPPKLFSWMTLSTNKMLRSFWARQSH